MDSDASNLMGKPHFMTWANVSNNRKRMLNEDTIRFPHDSNMIRFVDV